MKRKQDMEAQYLKKVCVCFTVAYNIPCQNLKSSNEEKTCHYYFSGRWVDDYSRDHQCLYVSPFAQSNARLVHLAQLVFFKVKLSQLAVLTHSLANIQ